MKTEHYLYNDQAGDRQCVVYARRRKIEWQQMSGRHGTVELLIELVTTDGDTVMPVDPEAAWPPPAIWVLARETGRREAYSLVGRCLCEKSA